MPTPARSAPVPEGQDFFDAWHALDKAAQKRIRRLVLIGRPVEPDEAPLAVAFARFQSKRPWQRFFWWWFLPAAVLVLGVAATVHPVVVGVVVMAAFQAGWRHVNLGRAEKINKAALRLAPG